VAELYQVHLFVSVSNALLTLAPIPKHPLNADRLHRILSIQSMPIRDAWWSTFLHREWHRHRAVDRLVEWAWGDSTRSRPSDEVVILAGTAIAWFLTSSNRFLRDRATKAMVKLYDNKLPILVRLLERFWDVDDPYVLERLMAVGYGCAMRCSDSAGLADLAEHVAQHVFCSDNLLPQLLTRDYASGIVASAKAKGVILKDAFPESIPPYQSKWPAIKIPSARAVEKWGKWHSDSNEEERARHEIYSSLISRHSDFSRYVVGDLAEWTSIRIGSTPPKSPKQLYDEFQNDLSPRRRAKFESMKTVFENVRLLLRLELQERKKILNVDLSDEQLHEAKSQAEDDFLRSIAGDRAKARVYKNVMRQYLEGSKTSVREYSLDAEVARRWMLQRVIDYGWNAERFARFDRYIDHRGRSSRKAERIGKKYQWIAFHELLARLADNFSLRKDRYSFGGTKLFSGVWEIGYGNMRDIDPSVTIRSTHENRMDAAESWWSPVSYTTWGRAISDSQWLRKTDDLPTISEMLRVQNPDDGSDWLVLETKVGWKERARPGRRDYDLAHRDLYLTINSYLVRKADAASFFKWRKGQRFITGPMLESSNVYSVALGEFYWSPAYQAWAQEANVGWTRGDSGRVPYLIMPTSLTFSHQAGGYDCSVDNPFSIILPAPELFQGLDLNFSMEEGRFNDAKEALLAFDPSVHEEGPGALLIRAAPLMHYLSEKGLELIWTIVGEKQVIGGQHGPNELGWLEIDGVFKLTTNGIEGDIRAEHRMSSRVRKSPSRTAESNSP
jgi:hypothetical protein